jgi:hypothetical protein
VEVSDERVRVVGLTCPAAGQILVRLQSLASQPVDCTLSLGFDAHAAWTASFLGEARTRLDLNDSTVATTVPTFGTAAVLLALDER